MAADGGENHFVLSFEKGRQRHYVIGSYVMAMVDKGKLAWPVRIEEVDLPQELSSKTSYWVYCRSDNAILPARKILPFNDINTWIDIAERDGVIRAYDSLKTICAELSLIAPERITSVSMRKYIATLSQVIDMKDHELEWLCNHLGHTASIHKLHYRATSGFIERVNIGKLMLLQDMNLAGKYAGQRLQDIDISEVINSTPEKTTPQLQAPENEQDHEIFHEDNDEDEIIQKKKTNIQRKIWTAEEEEELEELFAENFKLKKNPGLKECTSAIAKSRKKKGVIHKRSWETIKKKVLRMIKKNL